MELKQLNLFIKYLLLVTFETDDNYSIWFEISNNSWTIQFNSIRNEKKHYSHSTSLQLCKDCFWGGPRSLWAQINPQYKWKKCQKWRCCRSEEILACACWSLIPNNLSLLSFACFCPTFLAFLSYVTCRGAPIIGR